jgi:2-aminomuconate deaminase
MSTTHISSNAPEPMGAYPHARREGNLLFLSGIGPRKRGSKEIPGVTLDANGKITSYDIAEQTRSVFANVRAVLESAGARWEDLVDVTVFLTNMAADFAIYNRLWAEYFPENPPCRTTLGITALPTPIAIELKCIAVVQNQEDAGSSTPPSRGA